MIVDGGINTKEDDFHSDPLTKEEIMKQEEAEIREKQYRGL